MWIGKEEWTKLAGRVNVLEDANKKIDKDKHMERGRMELPDQRPTEVDILDEHAGEYKVSFSCHAENSYFYMYTTERWVPKKYVVKYLNNKQASIKLHEMEYGKKKTKKKKV